MLAARQNRRFRGVFGDGRGGRLALVASIFLGGCASTKVASAPPTDPAALERLRAENAGHVRRVEELENQVFVLTSELDARRKGAPPPQAPPVLPEVKLSKAEASPAVDPGGSSPASLVDETEVEYAGAAAERGTSKRPVLKLWGPGGGEEAAPAEPETAPAEVAEDKAPPASKEPARRRLARRPPRNEPPARPAPAAAPAASADAAAGNAAYQAALAHLRGGRHDEAVAALRGFVASHPDHDLADNAQYWLGECFYDRKDYSTALREFQRVTREFPSGNKVPDALLKLGLSYLGLGSVRPGREALADLARRFPQHPAASLAEAKLAELTASGATTALAPADKTSKEVR